MAKQRKSRHVFRWLLLLLLVLAIVGVFRQGLLPVRFTPLPAIDLANDRNWLVDWRLAELKTNNGLCRSVMIPPHVSSRMIEDKPLRKGCGWINAVRLRSAGGARISVSRLSCQTAAAFALWMTHDVQPLAKQLLGSKVLSISHMGTYSCRNIIGRSSWRKRRSQHATANAIDIASFKLANGSRVSVKKHWRGSGKRAEFLRQIHQRACRYFRVALGPDYNKAHHDHFHYDRGSFSSCR